MRDLPNVYTPPVDTSLSREIVDALVQSGTRLNRAFRIVLIASLYALLRALVVTNLVRILLTLACVAVAIGLYRMQSSFREGGERAQPDGLGNALGANLLALRIAVTALAVTSLLALAVVLAEVVPALSNVAAISSNEQQAVDAMSVVADSIDRYVIRHGELPQAGSYPALREELRKDGSAELPELDPWGSGYEYRRNDEGYSLTSFGADGRSGLTERAGPDVRLASGVFVFYPQGVKIAESRR